jgi:hypothetical protein
MSIRFELPVSIAKTLQDRLGDLDQAAKEALLVQAFRDGKLSHYELSQALGIDRFETDALLKRYKVTEGSLTFDDLEADRQTLERVLGPVRR